MAKIYGGAGQARHEQRKLDYLERVCDRVEEAYNRKLRISPFAELRSETK